MTDRAVAAKFQATLTKDDIVAAHRRHGLKVEPGKVLCDKIVPHRRRKGRAASARPMSGM